MSAYDPKRTLAIAGVSPELEKKDPPERGLIKRTLPANAMDS